MTRRSAPEGASRTAAAKRDLSDRTAAITEADRFLDAGSRVLTDALLGGEFPLVEAAEHMVVLVERARRFLATAAVAA